MTFRRCTATESDELGLGFAVEDFRRSFVRSHLASCRRFESLVRKLRPNSLNLPPRHADQIGDLFIASTPFGVSSVAQQQNLWQGGPERFFRGGEAVRGVVLKVPTS